MKEVWSISFPRFARERIQVGKGDKRRKMGGWFVSA